MRRYYYRNYSHRNNYNNEFDPVKAGFIMIFLTGLGFWYAYKSIIYNFFNQYGIALLIMMVLIFVAILIIKKEIKLKKEYNIYKKYNPIQTNQIKINNTNLDQIKLSTHNNDLFVTDNKKIKDVIEINNTNTNTNINQIKPSTHNNDLFVMDNEEIKKQNYAYNNYNHVLINQINEVNCKNINEEENLEQITNINLFLKTVFREIFSNNEIYSISGYLRRLHPKVFEDLIELIFRIQGYDIVKRSTWRGSKGYRKANPDGGIDITCKKENQIEYIQIKNTVSEFISSHMVRDFDSATIRKRNPGDKVKIITTTLFGDPAIKTANEDNIIMIDYSKLNKIIYSIYDNKIDRKVLQDFFINNCYPKEEMYGKNNNECPWCGAPLKLRKEGFFGCQNYYKTGCSYIRKATTSDVLTNIVHN